jgi:hypothetical protein
MDSERDSEPYSSTLEPNERILNNFAPKSDSGRRFLASSGWGNWGNQKMPKSRFCAVLKSSQFSYYKWLTFVNFLPGQGWGTSER